MTICSNENKFDLILSITHVPMIKSVIYNLIQMFFKKEIESCLKLNDIIKIVLPDKSLEYVKPTSYLNVAKSSRSDLDAKSDHLNNHLKDILNERLPGLIDDVNRNQKSTQVNLVFDRSAFLVNTLSQFKHGVNDYVNFFGHETNNKKILIEFSSPNIAKKLHFGNFRSTLTGNFLANLLEYKGYNLTKINYYGDWGTQFGMLSAAFDKFGDKAKLDTDPIRHLIDIYVKGNEELEKNPEFHEESKRRFALLESSVSDETNEYQKQETKEEQIRIRKQWELFRSLSLEEYAKDYAKLGVKFDLIQFESMFNCKVKELCNDRSNPNLVFKDDGSVCFKVDKRTEEIVIKSDGSTLYLSRDLAAAIERKKEFDFDVCYYVVDSSQSGHFKKLKSILKKMNHDWTSHLSHVVFGRINNMSTRKGTVTLLDEVFEVSKKLSAESTLQNQNKRVTLEELENTKFDLALASLIVNIFKHKRTTNLDFDLNDFTYQSADHNGISLMYAYSRLCNLKLNSGFDLDLNCEIDPTALEGNESYYLLLLLSQFDQIIEDCCFLLEPRLLIDYLFLLKSAINRAYQAYPVKGESNSTAHTRLLLFHSAQQVYRRALQLSGINPLERI